MVDAPIDFEQRDTEGETVHQNGTVGTSAIAVPTTATGVIDEVNLECMETNDVGENLLVSFDGGTNFKTLLPGDSIFWSPKGNVTQITIKGATAGVEYEALINRGTS